jgi:peptidoglycan L-alanyl-D-glutamate endopeptidase CwlK
MFKFSEKSENILKTCHPDLQTLAAQVMALQIFDFGITCGHRTEEDQNKAFAEGKSKLKWPNGNHNKFPSDAFDFVIYLDGKATYDNKDMPSYYMAVGIFRVVALQLGMKLRVGADWDGNFNVKDQTFNDVCHIERL